MNYKDPSLHYKVNIGLPVIHTARKDVVSDRIKHHLELKKNQELELAAKHRTRNTFVSFSSIVYWVIYPFGF